MTNLNFPGYPFQIFEKNGKLFIFDQVRRKYVALTPEEWVRQHVISYLAAEKQVPLSLMGVESEIRLFGLKKRFDLVVFDRNGTPLLLTECKAPSVPLSQAVLDQAVRYNMTLKVQHLLLTNGLKHIYCRILPGSTVVLPGSEIPNFNQL